MSNIKTYSLKRDGNKKISDNFKVKEFACKDGSDKIIIDLGLLPFLENIRRHFNCRSANIYSGYRTPSHDKKVGGSGKGPHTKGYAVDVKFIGNDGKYISSNKICCYAGDIKMNGIAKCSSYGVHLDIKSRKWWADETVKERGYYKSVSDFYAYFKLTKEDIYNKIVEAVTLNKEKDQIETIVNLKVRIKPSIESISLGTISRNCIYDYYETVVNEDLTWYRIGINQWVADNGKYLKIHDKVEVIEPNEEATYEEYNEEVKTNWIILLINMIINFFKKIFKIKNS